MNWNVCAGLVALAGATLTAAPTLTGFAPATGAPGRQVTLTGVGLSTATRVEFDTVLADFRMFTNDQLVAVVPATALTGRIRVTNPTGTGSSFSDFVVAPRLTGFSPERGAAGTVVTLNGANLSGMTNVAFNGAAAAFTETAPTQIRATVPAGATTGPIRVAGPAGAAVAAQAFVVTGPEPIIDRFVPPYAAPGTEILIEGANFANLLGVVFNATAASSFTAPASTQLRVIVPGGPDGRVTVTVRTAGGTSSSAGFEVTTLPVITGFTPVLGKAGQTVVTIDGVNFANLVAPGVWFNTQPVASYSSPAPNQLRVTVPTGATTGPIWVRNTAGFKDSLIHFVVTLAPIINRVDPPMGNPGTKVRLYGDNFTGITQVTFNGVPAAYLPPPAPTQMEATVPASATTGPIQVVNSSRSFTTTSNFVVTPVVPFITRVTPGGGPRGTDVHIHGVNFGSAPWVRFTGVTDPTAYVVTEGVEQKIFAHAPGGAISGPITVVGPSGTNTNSAWFDFPPWVMDFEPTNGVVGSTVYLLGTNLLGTTQLRFRDAPAPFTAEPGWLTAIVPEQAQSGPLTVVSPGGLITSTNVFQVLPRLTNFTPALGATGTVVRLRGTSLHNVSGVTFNGVSAPFTNISFTEVHAVVPASATTGPIRMDTPDGADASAGLFLVIGPSDLLLNSWPSSALIPPNTDFSYTLAGANAGPWTVSDVVLSGQLPASLTNVTVQSGGGSCSVSGGWLECRWDYWTSGEQATVEVIGRFESEGYAYFTTRVVAAEEDLQTGNNDSTAAVVVAADASRDLHITRAPNAAEVLLAWPTSAIPFQLEWSAGPRAMNAWRVVTNAPAPVAGEHRVTNAVADPPRIYRLRAAGPQAGDASPNQRR